MREYSREMNQRALEAKEAAAREIHLSPVHSNSAMMQQTSSMSNSSMNSPRSDVPTSRSTSPTGKRSDPAVGLDDEEGKRNLITNEIQMFRDRFKDEDTKMRNTEKERKDRYERERALQREKRLVEETSASGNHHSNSSPSSRDLSPPASSARDRSSPRRDRPATNRRDRSSPNDDRHRGSSSRNNTSNSVRSRTNDRRGGSPPSRYDRRSPVSSSRSYNRRSRTKSPMGKGHPHDEDDDETYERKKQERKLREKETHYREVSEHDPSAIDSRIHVNAHGVMNERRVRTCAANTDTVDVDFLAFESLGTT
jgi:hypothetical protein